MEHRLRTADGEAVYPTRAHTIEAFFGDHKESHDWTNSWRRGIDALSSEWVFANASHNLATLFTHQPQKQTSLA